MKRLVRLIAAAVLVAAVVSTAGAQTRQERKAAKEAAIKKMVADNHFYFVAQYAQPMTGGMKTLTSTYDLKVTKDSLEAFLPYYGVAHMAPNPTDIEGGIKFTTTKFSYTQNEDKKGGWRITIKPENRNITDWRDVRQMTLHISPDGYASLDVISSNRDPISYQGNVVAKE